MRGRKFTPPARTWPTRPTTDRSRESLFNILHNKIDFPSVRVLDLFGGTGAHSYEFISRGCTDVTYVDKHFPAVKFVQKTTVEWAIDAFIEIRHIEASRFIKYFDKDPFDYIFVGPPYNLKWLDEIPDRVIKAEMLNPSGLLVLEHNIHHDFSRHSDFAELRKYGDTHFAFFTSPIK